MLKLPTNTGTSFSSAGCIPPRSYHGLKARHPIGLITFPYCLYILEIYPFPDMKASPDTLSWQSSQRLPRIHILTDLAFSMNVLVIQKYDLREKAPVSYVLFFTLSAFVHFKKRYTCHLLKLLSSQSKSYCHKRIISSGRSHCVQLILDSLPSLVKVSADLVKCILDCTPHGRSSSHQSTSQIPEYIYHSSSVHTEQESYPLQVL